MIREVEWADGVIGPRGAPAIGGNRGEAAFLAAGMAWARPGRESEPLVPKAQIGWLRLRPRPVEWSQVPTVYEALFWAGAPQITKPFREEGADSKYTIYPGNGQSGTGSRWPPYGSEEAPKEVTVCLAQNNRGQAPKWPHHTWDPGAALLGGQ